MYIVIKTTGFTQNYMGRRNERRQQRRKILYSCYSARKEGGFNVLFRFIIKFSFLSWLQRITCFFFAFGSLFFHICYLNYWENKLFTEKNTYGSDQWIEIFKYFVYNGKSFWFYAQWSHGIIYIKSSHINRISFHY